ncbi:putative lipid II flippase FtsW [Blastochloris tepida]|uniref:Probable peptidoglycan glycosyltransferase FtsW n=1 Tax=Blastochloris tepida TaxID=2233851 RepID=A0A348FWB3_9HYPH|nr:putative lipid II flippase FtsW [Blastochloris tepida]BBF91596.1 cell division protein FtsW [Blastochloris tepida]
MVSRREKTRFGEWWWSVDRITLFAIGALIVIGVVLSLAASPAVAHRLGLEPFHFVNRQAFYLVPAIAVMIGTSLLSPRDLRRLCVVIFAVSVVMVFATLVFGAEIKGARRWLVIAGINIQPSEMLKPAFVVLAAWLFAESTRRSDVPALPLAFALLGVSVVPLAAQPDIGQTVLVVTVWCALFFLAGLQWIWMVGLGGVAVTGLMAAYTLVPHVTKRVDKFLNPDAAHDGFQIETALGSFASGGWFGRGPGEGTVKRILPDSHADFIFAVAAEEFGSILCIAIVGLFALVVLRSLVLALRDEDPFTRFATAGLALLFGMQAAINMSVNLHLIPAKGMTLPFISYGGSSLISLAFGVGMLLAFTRRRPRAEIAAEAESALRLAEQPR